MTTRRLLNAVMWVLSITSVSAYGQSTPAPAEPPKAETRATSPRLRPVDPRQQTLAWEFLLKRVDKVNWSETSFEEVLNWLRDQSEDRVNIIPNWRALNQEQVDAEKTITLQLRNTTISEILNEVVDQLADDNRVSFRAEGDKLRISTKQDFERKMEVRVYDVKDLLVTLPDFGENAPIIDLQSASKKSGGGGGGGGGQSVFGGSQSKGGQELKEEEEKIKTRLEDLRNMIKRTIEPQSWGGEGAAAGAAGGRGQIELFNNRALIILNTIEVHEQIAGFFSR